MSDNQNVNSRKLIDRLVPDVHWGAMHGLLSTTYELDPDFLELDFLPSVFGLGARSTWATRIAIEKRLSELDARATLLADARRYRRRPRSLQMEVLPVATPRGSALHAKVTLLVFDRAVRLIVGSANLTERGYRRNREGVAVLTASKESPQDAVLIQQALNGAERILTSWISNDARRLIRRAHDNLGRWASNHTNGNTTFCWSDGQLRLWSAFLQQWPADESIARISIVSPFWSENAGTTLKAFVAEMKRMGVLSSDAEVRLLTDVYEGANGEVLPVLPAGYATYDWSKIGVKVIAQPVSPRVLAEELGGIEDFTGKRDLHAKVLLVEGAKNGLGYVGSANFTAHGWGFVENTAAANIEAGLIIRAPLKSDRLKSLIPALAGNPIALTKDNAHFLAPPENTSGDEPWPEFIRHVLLAPVARKENELELIIKVEPGNSAVAWSAKLPARDGIAGDTLVEVGPNSSKTTFVVSLSRERLSRLLIEQEVCICWNECRSGRSVPINVDSAARDRLPVAPNQCIDESHLISYYQGKIAWEDLFPDPNPDPPGNSIPPTRPASIEVSGVDKSRIQSYQIREFVEALAGIRHDLKAAVRSERSTRLALSGAVSPLTLAHTVMEAVKTGRRTPMAAAFQLVEILGCLKSARSFEVSPALIGVWHQHLTETGKNIGLLLRSLVSKHPELFHHNKSFRRYEKAVLSMGSKI